jgi:hypothetical protein
MFYYLLEAKLILLMYYIKFKYVLIQYCCNCHYYQKKMADFNRYRLFWSSNNRIGVEKS